MDKIEHSLIKKIVELVDNPFKCRWRRSTRNTTTAFEAARSLELKGSPPHLQVGWAQRLPPLHPRWLSLFNHHQWSNLADRLRISAQAGPSWFDPVAQFPRLLKPANMFPTSHIDHRRHKIVLWRNSSWVLLLLYQVKRCYVNRNIFMPEHCFL